MNIQPIGLMVLRVWTEHGSANPLRVDVRQTPDLSRGLRRTTTLTDIDLVLASVRRFLEATPAFAPGPHGGAP
jgi:hypothetical protein